MVIKFIKIVDAFQRSVINAPQSAYVTMCVLAVILTFNLLTSVKIHYFCLCHQPPPRL